VIKVFTWPLISLLQENGKHNPERKFLFGLTRIKTHERDKILVVNQPEFRPIKKPKQSTVSIDNSSTTEAAIKPNFRTHCGF